MNRMNRMNRRRSSELGEIRNLVKPVALRSKASTRNCPYLSCDPCHPVKNPPARKLLE